MKDVTETELKATNTAIRVTEEDVKNNIVSVHYINAGEAAARAERRMWVGERSGADLLTFCIIVLKNGFVVTGESACAAPENYNKEIGERLAYQQAFNKIWMLMGYELKTKLALAYQATFPIELGLKDADWLDPLDLYVGTKAIRATPLTLGHYNHHRGWEQPENEDPSRLGYLVQYENGHVSWSPKEVFEASYQKVS